ncbi:MAG: hypothetical protein V3U62_09200 [Sedimenticolaceae bacterium]
MFIRSDVDGKSDGVNPSWKMRWHRLSDLEGLEGTDISLVGRILVLADAFTSAKVHDSKVF